MPLREATTLQMRFCLLCKILFARLQKTDRASYFNKGGSYVQPMEKLETSLVDSLIQEYGINVDATRAVSLDNVH